MMRGSAGARKPTAAQHRILVHTLRSGKRAGMEILMTRDHDRRQILTVAGGAVMSQLMTAGSAIAFDWTLVAPGEAGLTGDIGARLDKAIADKHIWNLHGLVIAR